MNTIVLVLYISVWMFLFGWFLGLDVANGKVNVRDISVDAFFGMIWPVTIVIYISEKVKDAINRKGGEENG